jgi:hypothetical protein
MKPAEELAAEIQHDLIWHQHEFKTDTGKEYLPFVIRQIQLDAMKEGMRRAARIADEAQYKTEPRDCMCAILSTAEALTEKDL